MANKSPEEIKEFETKIQGYMKNVLANFKDYEFFTGESMNPDGMVALMNYREDGMTPYFIFIKAGLEEEKYVCIYKWFSNSISILVISVRRQWECNETKYNLESHYYLIFHFELYSAC